jgi:hypothetical protein
MRNALSLAFLAVLAIGLLIDPSHAHHAPHAARALEHLTFPDLGLGGLGAGGFLFVGATNKVVLRTVEQFMAGYNPTYQPFYPLLLRNSIAYPQEVGKINFHRLEAVGDLRARHITPKDTEIFQIAVRDSSKTFKKYFLGNQYVQSLLQGREDLEGIVAQVLDENQKKQDDLVLLGEGTSASTMINNGLYWSNDTNYILNNSAQIDNAPDTQGQLYSKIVEIWNQQRDLSGPKTLVLYGDTLLTKYDSLIPEQAVSVRSLVEEAIGQAAVRLPSVVTPSSANGIIVVTDQQALMHYTVLPSLKGQGVNEEKGHSWHNFLMGSTMLEVKAYGGVIRQPLTFEA